MSSERRGAVCFEFFRQTLSLTTTEERKSMRKAYPSIEREKTIRSRQDPPTWGTGYLPGQFATREEAPDASRPHRVKCAYLGRDVHLMSDPELFAFLVGRWTNTFIDLHEGRMLSPEPSLGFLAGGPYGEQSYLGAHPGSISIAEELGLLKYLPVIKSKQGWIVYPLLSDLLFFGKDKNGFYSVNWSIKAEPEDFERSFKGGPKGEKINSDEEHQARLLIEDEIYKKAQIRTLHIALSDIPKNFRENLRLLYQYLPRQPSLPTNLQEDFIEEIRNRIPKQVPLFETMQKFVQKHGGPLYDYTVVLYKALWSSEIKCNLNRPVQMDLPLRPEEKDLRKVYEMWTWRGVV